MPAPLQRGVLQPGQHPPLLCPHPPPTPNPMSSESFYVGDMAGRPTDVGDGAASDKCVPRYAVLCCHSVIHAYLCCAVLC